MRSGLMINGAWEESAKQPTAEWVRKLTMKPPTFDLQKEQETFLQMQRDFYDMGASCSKTNDKRKGTTRIPLQSDPCAEEAQHQMNVRP